ncbi:hypothetical protein XW59_028640 [Aquamicrobium sp. LC103]|nr:hypothetical protein XW59_028640 [Aquamicrobium sp. LC103]
MRFIFTSKSPLAPVTKSGTPHFAEKSGDNMAPMLPYSRDGLVNHAPCEGNDHGRGRHRCPQLSCQSMSPESGIRFRDKDMRKNKDLKRGQRI